jgi:CHASE1-domain containing sensor protein
LRSHLIVLVLASLVPLIAFAAIAVVLFTRHERRAMERGAIETARAVVNAVDRELSVSVSILAEGGRGSAAPGAVRPFSLTPR